MCFFLVFIRALPIFILVLPIRPMRITGGCIAYPMAIGTFTHLLVYSSRRMIPIILKYIEIKYDDLVVMLLLTPWPRGGALCLVHFASFWLVVKISRCEQHRHVV
jgi:hypothetical protein